MRILFIGDVVGKPGREVVRKALKHLKREIRPDLVIANGENCAHGAGLTPSCAREMFRAGCHVLTGGNHTWDRNEVHACLDSDLRILRPANYPEQSPGRGVGVYDASCGIPVAVINLQGTVFMEPIDDPFQMVDGLLDRIRDRAKIAVVDFHAEATSEKVAMAWHLDGKVTAVVGTHTHVVTADESVLPGGTAYITDVGMTGPHDSVIGVEKEIVLERFLTRRPVRFLVAEGDVRLNAVLIEVDPESGKAVSIRRIRYPEMEKPGVTP
jgi:metallophosphoesterase (TIGR00282 family)